MQQPKLFTDEVSMFQGLDSFLAQSGFSSAAIEFSHLAFSLLLLFLAALIVHWITSHYVVLILEKIAHKSTFKWDDAFIRNHFFKRLAILTPLILIYGAADLAFTDFPGTAELLRRASLIFFVLAGVRVLATALKSFQDIYSSSEIAGDWPIRSYLDAIKIILYILAFIFITSILTNKSPWGIISVFGGLTAILLLIFKDTILGFVANLQLTANDMVRVGDWIEMPKYGADGDVIDISLHTVKVQNWDKTITTVPTHHMVNDAFKNWRGMSESGGRRIKRALYIDTNSVRFCTDENLEGFKKYSLLEGYLQKKEEEITEYNKTHHPEPGKLGGRRQTNIGVFRAYIKAYLRNNPKINQDLTFLVRHLAPTPQGLPVEIYVFSADKVWANYEGIQADIFDHLLAIAPEFGLRIFQYPSGNDLQQFQSFKATADALDIPA
ncbi:MAG: mechanosensitive ion channel family protein [Desulfobulbaceae bacterium]|uniref:Mechanosensing system component YbdG n=1 Tax=Candidatus Desulfobia pelagia TaxID=2841692 RepID=A0A8J6NEA7_9BACT|nr:mechanosensitive ion channel family protein [Candidatus Desulfobia pelagia]